MRSLELYRMRSRLGNSTDTIFFQLFQTFDGLLFIALQIANRSDLCKWWR
ncbi:hypothetical protein VB774_03925 [Pseudanabaena galeata UHCC 0370]|uniref:Uncharacterized protein n=1 Tax=Pseudanabaena galeata UHCC 0370 TaxID=3110310 RepID=A0ABU5TET0_9CYAN|nr:hypothetical protein [Pseudanabaena galeata]MEA5476761.1 hypothetical protein [Pseudanabaena galeata UHCC 0370]